jgi:hypothetical protein
MDPERTWANVERRMAKKGVEFVNKPSLRISIGTHQFIAVKTHVILSAYKFGLHGAGESGSQ